MQPDAPATGLPATGEAVEERTYRLCHARLDQIKRLTRPPFSLPGAKVVGQIGGLCNLAGKKLGDAEMDLFAEDCDNNVRHRPP